MFGVIRRPAVRTRTIGERDLLALSVLDYDGARWRPHDFRDWLLMPGRRGLVRIVGRRVVGFVLYSADADYKTIEIERLLVDPRCRRQWHGTRLLWEAVDSIAEYWDSRFVRAWISEMDRRAIDFFIANRFSFARAVAEETHIVDGKLRDELLYLFEIPPVPRRGKAA